VNHTIVATSTNEHLRLHSKLLLAPACDAVLAVLDMREHGSQIHCLLR